MGMLLFSHCHVRLCDPMDCSLPGFLSFPIPQSLLKLMFFKLVHPTISSSVTPFFSCPQMLTQHQGLFLRVSSLYQVAKVLATFSFSFSSSSEYSWLISFRINWFDLAVQGTQRVFSNTTVQKQQSFRSLFHCKYQRINHPAGGGEEQNKMSP